MHDELWGAGDISPGYICSLNSGTVYDNITMVTTYQGSDVIETI